MYPVEGFAHEACNGECVDEEPCFIASHGDFESTGKIISIEGLKSENSCWISCNHIS